MLKYVNRPAILSQHLKEIIRKMLKDEYLKMFIKRLLIIVNKLKQAKNPIVGRCSNLLFQVHNLEFELFRTLIGFYQIKKFNDLFCYVNTL